jgi:hypothetical protein
LYCLFDVLTSLHRSHFIPVAENARSHGKGRRVGETTLASQAAVSLINNGGKLDATLKELGSQDSLKQLATSLVTAGVLSSLGNAITVDGKASLSQGKKSGSSLTFQHYAAV